VLPLWEDIATYMPQIEEFVSNIKKNIELFYSLAENETA